MSRASTLCFAGAILLWTSTVLDVAPYRDSRLRHHQVHRRKNVDIRESTPRLAACSESPLDRVEPCQCLSTTASSVWAVDSRGKRCAALGGIDPLSGCCSWSLPPPVLSSLGCAVRFGTTPQSWASSNNWKEVTLCDSNSTCCSDSTACIACCLLVSPQAVAGYGVSLLKARVAAFSRCESFQREYANFEACEARCRPASSSVFHQNRYESPFHHCYA